MSTDPISKYDSYGLNYCTWHSDTYPYIKPGSNDLAGKHIILTGASKGIGYATALSFARAGPAAIVVTARSPLDQLLKEMESAKTNPSCKILALSMDITSRASVEAAAAQIQRTLTHLDIAILNAGTFDPVANIIDSDPAVWWGTYETNVLGTYLCLRSLLPLLIASPDPRKTVVSVVSAGATRAFPGISSYQSGKLAVSRLAEFVNAEVGGEGVMAYVVHPGGVWTESSKKMPGELHGILRDEVELPADALVWLVRERREWLKGRWVSCNWDMKELEEKRGEIEERDLLKFRLAMGGEEWSRAGG